MNSNDFVSADHILAEVLQTLDDRDYRRGFSKGWFMSRIQDALQELAFDTFFDTITIDKKFPKETLAMEMPENIFNVRELYLYNGGCCNPTTSQVVHWKRQYNNKGKGDGYTSKIKDVGGKGYADPFLQDGFYYNNSNFYIGTKFYANIQNGTIMFSSDCRAYNHVRLVVNGMGAAIGDKPIIPRFFERAINDYIEERYYNAMKGREPRKYRALWMDAKNNLNDKVDGSWRKAKMRITSMDTWQKESLEEYISAMYHK